MPRVHIHLHDLDEIEDLEEHEDWETILGAGDGRRDSHGVEETRARGERRFGGSEVIARKRADRRKSVHRVAKRA
jgi:hypothetical protein